MPLPLDCKLPDDWSVLWQRNADLNVMMRQFYPTLWERLLHDEEGDWQLATVGVDLGYEVSS